MLQSFETGSVYNGELALVHEKKMKKETSSKQI